jgi:hypothetical protein
MGVVGMCKEHLGVALALKVPVFFVITKVDICPEHVLKNTVQVRWGRWSGGVLSCVWVLCVLGACTSADYGGGGAEAWSRSPAL